MTARGIAALGAQLFDGGQPGCDRAVLPVLRVPLQRHRQAQEHEVGVGRPALAVGQPDAPVRPLLGHSKVGLSLGDRLLALQHLDLGMVRKACLQGLGAERHAVGGRLPQQRPLRVLAYPAGQLRDGAGDLAVDLVDAILDERHRRAGGEDIGLRTTTTPVSRLCGVDLQAGFVALGSQRVADALQVVAVEPGCRSLLLQPGDDECAAGFGGGGLALETCAAGLALAFACQLLGHADGGHREVVARETESVRAVDRQGVEADPQRRVGPLASRYRHVAGTRCCGVLRDDLQ